MENLFEKKIEKFTWKSPSKIRKILKNDKSEEMKIFKILRNSEYENNFKISLDQFMKIFHEEIEKKIEK
jgi:hypothetical protein